MLQWICTKFGDKDGDPNTRRLMHACSFTLNSVQVCTFQYKIYMGVIFIGHSVCFHILCK